MPKKPLIVDLADGSFLNSLLPPTSSSARDTDADSLNQTPGSGNREQQVRVFVKQLLTALQYMHQRNMVHLDLRPEAVLLQDDHLILADFGQSRHLLRGKVTSDIKSTPEFVSPEVASGRGPVTLAADMWSSGALTYVLLAGASPFLGDNDTETLANVVEGKFSLDIPVSDQAKDFLKRLLMLDSRKRMTVAQALEHEWIADPALRDAKLATDCLREFSYSSNWLNRRVFVQQTPSEQLTQYIDTPQVARVSSAESSAGTAKPVETKPIAMYDYLKIKDKTPTVEQPPPLPPKGVQKMAQFPPWLLPQLPPGVRPEDMLAWGIDPQQLALLPASAQQQKGAVGPVGRGCPPRTQRTDAQQAPLQMMRGERRQIEDEIANRILSDISEENSIAGSDYAALMKAGGRGGSGKGVGNEGEERSTSTTPQHSTDVSSAQSSTTTPLASPAPTGDSGSVFDGQQPFFPEDGAFPSTTIATIESALDPVNRQLHIDSRGLVERELLGLQLDSSPGVKSAIQLSPGQEHAMQVVISLGKGKEGGMAAANGEVMREIGAGRELAEQGKMAAGAQDTKGKVGEEEKKKYRPAPDITYDLLMAEVARIKDNIKMEKQMTAELDKYRPSNIYKDAEGQQEHRLDSYGWESNYQIGPETLLLATKGAAFNARVRDYRRELWGDGAPLVTGGILGYRNSDITVRERRRFTDLVREDPEIARSVATVTQELNAKHQGALRRIQPASQLTNTPNGGPAEPGGKFAPIFRRRLREAGFLEGLTPSVVLECEGMGNPTPELTFFHHESALVDDGRHKVERSGDRFTLTILRPIAYDAGEYSCAISNELGVEKCSCTVLCGEVPGKPSRPEVELSSDTEVLVKWEVPERLPVTLDGVMYRVECRPAGEEDAFAPWLSISDRVEDEAVVIKHLHPQGIYQFRVTAKNGFGWGEPSITSRIIQTHSRAAQKLNLNQLRRELRFTVIQMPQTISKRTAGLSEISEESEEQEDEDDEKAEGKEAPGKDAKEKSAKKDESKADSVKNGSAQGIPTLNSTDDPLKRFQLEGELFCGQFSVVRHAIDSKSGRHCVAKIKAATRGVGPSPPQNGTTFEEYEALARSQHENVVQLIAAYNSNNFLLLFTERLREDVFERFSFPESYTEEQICFTVRQLASALHWIHFKGVVHLSVEPSNVMFTSKTSWQLKLIDFGRAAISAPTRGRTAKGPTTRAISRLAEWTAPEVLAYERSRTRDLLPPPPANPQTDVWGLGLIAFCLLGGYHPFTSDDESEEEVVRNVLKQKCDPNIIPVQASEEALRFVTWALKKDPARRMRTGEALSHRFLSCDSAMIRRRQNIKYSSNRLRKTAEKHFHQRHKHLATMMGPSNGAATEQPPTRSSSGSRIGGRRGERGPPPEIPPFDPKRKALVMT